MLSKKRFACKDTMENGKIFIVDLKKLIQCLHTLASQIGITESSEYSGVEEDIFESFKSNIQVSLAECLAKDNVKGKPAQRKCVNDTIAGMKTAFITIAENILQKPENREKTDDSLIFGRIIKNMEYARRDFLKTKKLYRKLSEKQKIRRAAKKEEFLKRKKSRNVTAPPSVEGEEASFPKASYHSPYQIYSNMNRNVAYH